MFYTEPSTYGKCRFVIIVNNTPVHIYAVPCGTNVNFQIFTTEDGLLPYKDSDQQIRRRQAIFTICEDFSFKEVVGTASINAKLNDIFSANKPYVDPKLRSYCGKFFFSWKKITRDDVTTEKLAPIFQEFHIHRLSFSDGHRRFAHSLCLLERRDGSLSGTTMCALPGLNPTFKLAPTKEEQDDQEDTDQFHP